MTTTEFNNEFDIHYNSIASQSAPGLDAFEKSVFLTKAQLEIVKNHYDSNGNKYKNGFEDSEKRRVDLKELLKDYSTNTKVVSVSGISNQSQFFSVPNDTFLVIYENGTISTTDCNNGKEIKIIPKTHDEFNIQIDNPFKKPDLSVIWRLNMSKINNQKIVELISPFNISKYHMRYVKYPKPIILTNLTSLFPGENLTIDGIATEQTSELDSGIHREILDRAVEIALRDYKPSNLESKIQMDQRNE